MSFYSVSENYRKLWIGTSDPQFVHIIFQDDDDFKPRIMHENHDYVEISYVVEGKGTIFVKDASYEVSPGDIIIYNPGIPHDQKMKPGQRFVTYTLAATEIHSVKFPRNHLLSEDMKPVMHSGVMNDNIKNILDLIYLQLNGNFPGKENTVHYLMMAFLTQVYQVIEHYSTEKVSADQNAIPLAIRVRSFLDEHFCEDITLQSLAEMFKISTYYLSHMFKDQFGYPPLQYILRRRIGLAQTLLITTDLSVTEIGNRVGYVNPSHFNLIFTKNVGISPRRYRINYIN